MCFSSMNKIIQSLADEYLAPLLKSNGFKKKGITWNRQRADLIDVIDIEKLRYSDPAVPQIRGAVAICVPKFRAIMFDQSPGTFQIGDGIFHVSFAALRMRDFSGRELEPWLDLTDGVLHSAGEMLRDTIRDHAIPFLESLKSYEDLQEFLQELKGSQTKMPYYQINKSLIDFEAGDIEKCRATLDSLKVWPEIVGKVRTYIELINGRGDIE